MGIGNASSSIVAFLDDDAKADPKWLEKIVATFRKDEKAIGLGGKILSADNTFLGKFSESLFNYGKKAREIKTITGVNMSFHLGRIRSMENYKRKNIFNQNYVFAGEETEACFCLSSKGGRLIYNPGVVVYHRFPSSLLILLKKQTLYAAGDFSVMTSYRYRKFSLIDDYLEVFKISIFNHTTWIISYKVVFDRALKYLKVEPFYFIPFFLLKEISYAYSLYVSYLKAAKRLK